MLSLKLLYKSPLANLLKWMGKKKEVMRALDDPSLETDPFRAEYVRSIPEAQLFRGVLLQGYLVPANILEALDDMLIRDDDVFIITYPKSGTTWTEEIVSLIYEGGNVDRVKNELLIYRVHHLEVGRIFGHLRFLSKLPSPRLMATHLPLSLLPKQLRKPKCKIIYVMRNPKDNAVSYYHHHQMSKFLGNTSASWDEFLAHFLAGHIVYGSWFDHVLPYWEFCKENPENVFFMSYEELKLDLRGMVMKLSEFLGRELSEESVDTIVDHCTFESMKANKMVNREKLPISDLFDMTKSKFMRKGIVGDWQNYFTEEQNAAFEEVYKRRMADSDLHIEFVPDQALQTVLSHGRIIYNHPERNDLKTISDNTEDTPCDSLGPFYKPEYPFMRSWIPSLSLHVQQDPLPLDAVA